MNCIHFCLCLILLFGIIPENDGHRSGKRNESALTRHDGCGKVSLAEDNPILVNKSDLYFLAKSNNFPSFVTIKTKSGHRSAGILISDRHVITKASLVQVDSKDVEVASTFTNPGKWPKKLKRYQAEKICISPKFKRTTSLIQDPGEEPNPTSARNVTTWNFAVILLKEAVEFSDKVQPACLPSLQDFERSKDEKQYWLGTEPMMYLEGKWKDKYPNFNRIEQVHEMECGVEGDESRFCRRPERGNSYPCADRNYEGPLMSIDKDKRAIVYGFATFGRATENRWPGTCGGWNEKIVFSNLAKQSEHIQELISKCSSPS